MPQMLLWAWSMFYCGTLLTWAKVGLGLFTTLGLLAQSASVWAEARDHYGFWEEASVKGTVAVCLRSCNTQLVCLTLHHYGCCRN